MFGQALSMFKAQIGKLSVKGRVVDLQALWATCGLCCKAFVFL